MSLGQELVLDSNGCLNMCPTTQDFCLDHLEITRCTPSACLQKCQLMRCPSSCASAHAKRFHLRDCCRRMYGIYPTAHRDGVQYMVPAGAPLSSAQPKPAKFHVGLAAMSLVLEVDRLAARCCLMPRASREGYRAACSVYYPLP